MIGFGCTRFGEPPLKVVRQHSLEKKNLSDDIVREIGKIRGMMKNVGVKHLVAEARKKFILRNLSLEEVSVLENNIEKAMAVEVLRSTNPKLFRKEMTYDTTVLIEQLNSMSCEIVDHQQSISDAYKEEVDNLTNNAFNDLQSRILLGQFKFTDPEQMLNIIVSTVFGEAGSVDHSLLLRLFGARNKLNYDDASRSFFSIVQLFRNAELQDTMKHEYLSFLRETVSDRVIYGLLVNDIHDYSNYSGVVPAELIYIFKYVKYLCIRRLGMVRLDHTFNKYDYEKLTYDITTSQMKTLLDNNIIKAIRI